MMGANIDDDVTKGVIPRIVEQVFASIAASPMNIEYTVKVSYMEIYMEKIRDLLDPINDNLPVHEEKSRGVYVKGLLEIYVSSVAEVYEVMRRGDLARATAATNMNQESSRSHSIFVVTIGQKNVETGSAKSGQLFLVDLAGSEKVGKTGASGQTLEEAKKINKSLSALGMVINALTDGKATHIPYRDSKLTRILQESLGGNSRTTLIINCSPSSYNVEETISTLRFGTRAKKIENKAKVNAELSPAELKTLLKKAQTQVTTFEDYISNLEGEVSQWRSGESVPQDRWIPKLSQSQPSHRRLESKAAPATPSRTTSSDVRRAETPSRPESRMELDRASTPSVVLERDEREDFLRRENELQDQLSERESQQQRAEQELKQAKAELQALRTQQRETSSANERLQGEANGFKMEMEKIQFEGKETMITMDGLKEQNAELTSELDSVKQELLDAKISISDTQAVLDEKEKKKAERMAHMMAGFDLGGDAFSENEQSIRRAIEEVDRLHDVSSAGNAIAPQDVQDLRKRLVDAQGIVRQAELSVAQRTEHDEAMLKRREALEERLSNVEREYEEVLEKGLSQDDVENVKQRLGDAYVNRQSVHSDMADGLREDLSRAHEESSRLRSEVDSLQQRIQSGALTNGSTSNSAISSSKTIQQQIADFDVMKKSLMRDLQNRCERVVELEISLDETREQYNNVLRTSNNRAQQKKMAFLERNLEQLTHVQRQLVEQNNSLKKEVAIAERKLIARNERIASLESLLQDSQEKLTAANHRFENQLAAVKERLEAAKVGSTRGLAVSNGVPAGGTAPSLGSRIAKPLRGGQEVNGQVHPADLANQKRASWYSRAWPTSGSWT
ncbi:MAG: hypothetical protein Q9159_003774 [Coniocarpon cinnabarinum]